MKPKTVKQVKQKRARQVKMVKLKPISDSEPSPEILRSACGQGSVKRV